MIELTIQSLIHPKDKNQQPRLVFHLSIGETMLKWWNADDDSNFAWDADMTVSQKSTKGP
jgi:hypothetical protein